jgi:flagellar M-ring protein FliF
VATFAVIAFMVFLVIYTNSKKADDYAILFDNISANDFALVIAELKKNNIPYKIVNENTIKVPKDKDVVYKERIAIASKGIPKSSNIGFELFDKTKSRKTDFAQKIEYLRALEKELSRTVESLVPIKSARVHIAIPKDTLFVEKGQRPTASVVVTLQPNMKLSFKQIIGIKNLVAESVPKLKSGDVKLIDENGNPLDDEDLSGYDDNLVKTQIRYKKDFERAYEKKIVDVLAPILGGKDKVVAKVNIDFDFKQKVEKSEYYDPENVVRSEKTIEEKRTGASKEKSSKVTKAISDIGAIQPNGSKFEGEKYEKSLTTTNYEISKKITDIKGEFATIKKITVAVVVDGKYKRKKDKDGKELDEIEYIPLPKQELTKIEEIVKNSFGYDAKRGDSVSVSNFEFSPYSLKKGKSETFISFVNNYLNPTLPFLKYLFVGILLFLFYKNFIVPFGEKMLQSYEGEVEDGEDITAKIMTEEDNSSLEQYNKIRKKIESELGVGTSLDQEEIRHKVLLEKIKKDIENSPEEIARIIKSILDTDSKDI